MDCFDHLCEVPWVIRVRKQAAMIDHVDPGLAIGQNLTVLSFDVRYVGEPRR